MERLCTPWRMKYVTSSDKKIDGCIFCAMFKDASTQDRENLLVYRGQNIFTVMNLYPYNSGHLMVLPQQHVAALTDVPFQVQAEIMAMTSYLTGLLTDIMNPDGFNVGINLGRAAGAGIDTHLHLHVVPRWNGDSNFMPVVGQTRILPEELPATYEKITAYIKKQPPQWPPAAD
jgi:ATP adenylyltransferase